jgi:uncharacterized metal-binding protein YceD (DUF177 family)
MFRFKLHEIPLGDSQQRISLSDALELLNIDRLRGGSVEFSFVRAEHLLQVKMAIQATVDMLCDRSLEAFEYSLQTQHIVLYKSDLSEESDEEGLSLRKLPMQSQSIELTDAIRDSILLALPIRAIHPRFYNDDGSLSDFGVQQFGDLQQDAADAPVDKRWAKLQELKDNPQ